MWEGNDKINWTVENFLVICCVSADDVLLGEGITLLNERRLLELVIISGATVSVESFLSDAGREDLCQLRRV